MRMRSDPPQRLVTQYMTPVDRGMCGNWNITDVVPFTDAPKPKKAPMNWFKATGESIKSEQGTVGLNLQD